LIDIKNITKQYTKNKILENFSLHVEQGSRVVLFGASGSGKSTLLRIIAGLENIDNGEIYIDAKLVSKKNEIIIQADKREIGFVFQDLALWPHLNVAQNIEFGLKIKKVDKEDRVEKVKEILKKVNLSGFESREISQLSGGQKQRVALARTLVVNPKIILMDEPLSSLDYELNTQLRQEILSLQKEFKFTLVYVTHNKEEAEFLADNILYM